jgi:hypothetical protein
MARGEKGSQSRKNQMKKTTVNGQGQCALEKKLSEVGCYSINNWKYSHKLSASPMSRCKLHLACITHNPSRFAFYAGGIMREFRQASPFALCVVGSVLFCFGVSLVNLFF